MKIKAGIFSDLNKKYTRGFSLIETLVAMSILAGALVLLSNAWTGSFAAIRKSKLHHDVSLLLERKMTEIELEYRGKPLSEIPEEEEEDFGKDYPNFSWKMTSRQLEIPDMSSMLLGGDENGNEMLATLFKQLFELINKSVKEVKVSIIVADKKKTREYSLVTYFVDYDQPLPVPGGGG